MTLPVDPVPDPGTTGPGGQPIGEPDRDGLPDEEQSPTLMKRLILLIMADLFMPCRMSRDHR